MKRFRLPVLLGGVVLGLLVLAVIVAFSSAFQTWIVQRSLARQPTLRASVGNVSAGMKRVDLANVRYERNGAVLVAPSVAAELPVVSAAWSQQILVSRLVAKGWTLDLSRVGLGSDTSVAQPGGAGGVVSITPPSQAAPGPTPAAGEGPATSTSAAPTAGSAAANAAKPGVNQVNPAAAPAPVASAREVFQGLFAQLRLPFDLALDGVDLEGDVILPASRGRVHVTVNGGGVRAGSDGTLGFVARAALTDASVSAVEIRGDLRAAMDTPRTFTRVSVVVDSTAAGTAFPRGVGLHSEVTATRGAAGENFTALVATPTGELLRCDAKLDPATGQFAGNWSVDARDTTLAPFAFGKPLPAFAVLGHGRFETDVSFSAVAATGHLAGTLDRLRTLRPDLPETGELKVSADFNIAEQRGRLLVRAFEGTVAAAEPVFQVRALQPFEVTPDTGEFRASDVTRELFGLSLLAVPLSWAQAWTSGLHVDSGVLRGELVANARGGGITLRSTSPVSVTGLNLLRDGKPLVQAVDVTLGLAADYTPQGWQADVSAFTVKHESGTLFTLDAKAGQLRGADQPIKATGRITLDLPKISAQPIATGGPVLTAGTGTGEFVVSLGATREVQTSLVLDNLATVVETKAIKLPSISTYLRADLAADGAIAFHLPITLERDQRKSDLTLSGKIGAEHEKARTIAAEITSERLVVDDAQILGALFGFKPNVPQPAQPEGGPSGAPWAGWNGAVGLQLKQVIYSDTFQVSNVTGRLTLDAGKVKLEGLQAGLGENGRANLKGTVTFDASLPQPYTLEADVALREFDPGPLLRASRKDQPPTVEGRFDLLSKLGGHATSLRELVDRVSGDVQVTSKAGVFRGLPLSVTKMAETTSKLAAVLSSAGSAISSIAGKKDLAEIANKSQAVAELARGFNPIVYDQLSVVLTRDAALNTQLKDFTLIAPEMRLSGTGTAVHRPGSSLLEDALAMEFTLRARGRQGELLKYLGALDALTDDLGYQTCTVPLRVGGTLGQPDTSEVNGKLAALALEKAGVTDKAAEFVNKIFGGAK